MPKRAVVLGGGGARGPYQIGVWTALRELGIDYSIVTGSSVGALNGALMVQGDLELAREMWLSLTTRDIIAEMPDFSSAKRQELLSFLRQSVEGGGMDITPLENTLRRTIDENIIRHSPVQLGIVTSQYPFLRPVQLLKDEIPPGELVDYLLASSSWFPFFRRKSIDGVDYIDGAYADNLPAELAARCGAEEIIAVDLQGAGIVHAFRGDIPVKHIRSHWNLGDMLVFSPEVAARNLRMGYHDGLKSFRRLEGNAYAFPVGETRNNAYRLRAAIRLIESRTGVSLFRQHQRLPRIQEMLRYRGIDNRFLSRQPVRCSLGRAITAAAEIAGELMQVPPDKIYTLEQFNALLQRRLFCLRLPPEAATDTSLFYSDSTAITRRPRLVLRQLYRMLRDGCIAGRVSDGFWQLATISPVEFVAANYLLAVELAANHTDL